MAFLLKQIFSLVKLLNSDKGTNQIAAGVAFGLILGLTPAFSLQTVLVIFCLFFFRVQIGAATVTAAFFALPAYLLDPLFHAVGSWVLEQNSLLPLFTSLYHVPIVPLTRFYNSVVMGSGVVAILLAPLTFLAARKLIQAYRARIVARFEQTKLWKGVKATAFFQWYEKYERLYG